jgi:diguanylate cyclase (GGDEF)-like protein
VPVGEALVGEQAAVAEMRRLVHTDSLTGLTSRRQFIELAEQELGRFRRYNTRFAVLIVDLDHFKPINDTYGHNAGDEVLRRFADLMRRQSRRNDLVGRLGGEEFCLVLPETSLAAAQDVAERIVAECRQLEVVVDGHLLGITVSVGVTEVEPDDRDFSSVLRRADSALYAAKDNGRDRVETLPRQQASSY